MFLFFWVQRFQSPILARIADCRTCSSTLAYIGVLERLNEEEARVAGEPQQKHLSLKILKKSEIRGVVGGKNRSRKT